MISGLDTCIKYNKASINDWNKTFSSMPTFDFSNFKEISIGDVNPLASCILNLASNFSMYSF